MAKKNKDKPEKPSGDGIRVIARNKKARHNYELIEKVEAGLKLVGTEVKSLREGRCSIEEAYVRLTDEGAEVVGMHIPEYRHGNLNNHDPYRPRRLLLQKRQLRKLRQRIEEKGLTVVPTSVYFARGNAKLEIAVARGKKTVDKRADLKRRDQEREMKRALKEKY